MKKIQIMKTGSSSWAGSQWVGKTEQQRDLVTNQIFTTALTQLTSLPRDPPVLTGKMGALIHPGL